MRMRIRMPQITNTADHPDVRVREALFEIIRYSRHLNDIRRFGLHLYGTI